MNTKNIFGNPQDFCQICGAQLPIKNDKYSCNNQCLSRPSLINKFEEIFQDEE